jgi:hypothetical protein
MKYAVLAAVPVALVVGAVFKTKKPDPARPGPTGENGAKPEGK